MFPVTLEAGNNNYYYCLPRISSINTMYMILSDLNDFLKILEVTLTPYQ